MSTVFLETTADRHTQVVGGLTVLERRVREAARQGATRVVIAAAPVVFPRALPVPVEFVAPGTAAPAEARSERADVVAGIELVDERARKSAEWKLIRGLNKSFEGPVDALINWRFSMRLTRFLSHRPMWITPNLVTCIAILVGLSASVVAVRGGYGNFALAGVLLQTQSILDSSDGELARLRYQFSRFGQWLDNMSDDVVDNLFIASVGYALGGVWWTIGLAVACTRVACAIATYIDVYRRTGTGDVMAFRYWFESDSQSHSEIYDPKKATTWMRSIGRRDTFVFIWMVVCVCNFPYWVIGHAALITAVTASMMATHFLVFGGKRVTS